MSDRPVVVGDDHLEGKGEGDYTDELLCISGPSNRLVVAGDDPLEGEGEDDDDEGIVETDDGVQDDTEQAVTETEKVRVNHSRAIDKDIEDNSKMILR